MSQDKSLFERLNSIQGKGPERWLSRTLFENPQDPGEMSDEGGDMNRPPRPIRPGQSRRFAGNNPQRPVNPAPVAQRMQQADLSSVPSRNRIDDSQDNQAEASELSSERADELEQTSLNDDQTPRGTTLANVGGGMSARRLNEVVDRRRQLREQYERELAQTDQDEREISSEGMEMRQALDELIMGVGSGDTEADLRRKFIAIAARARTTPRKVREGKGARSITTDDREALLAPAVKQALIEGFGDGSWGAVKRFGDSRKIFRDLVSDELAQRWYQSQPSNIQQVFQSAGDLGSKDGGRENHFNGFDENGQKIAGRASSISRTLALAKVYLQQAGLDGFTGHPLEFEHMEPDHIRGYQTKINGIAPTPEDRFNTDHPDNWLWTTAGINNKKSNYTLPKFLENLEGMAPRDARGLMSGATLNLQDEGIRYLADDTTDFARSHVVPHEDDQGTVNILGDTLTQEMIDERQNQQLELVRGLQDAGTQVDESRLLTDIFAAGGSLPREQRLNLPSQNKSDIRERSQARIGDNATREMFSSMVGLSPQEQARISRGWKSSWDDAIQTIREQFEIYDNAVAEELDEIEYTDSDIILKDDEDGRRVVHGGPTLRKLFKRNFQNTVGGDIGERIANQINVREWLDVDVRLFF